MAQFQRYFNQNLHEWIETAAEHDRITEISKMSLEELGRLKDKLTDDTLINPAYENSHEFKIQAKSVIRALQAANDRGDVLVVRTGPPLTFGSVCMAAVSGLIMGDIASTLWSGTKGDGGLRQYLKPQK
jgi:hypothetical protein